MTGGRAAPLSPLDIACGIVIDPRPPRRAPPLPRTAATPVHALERAVLPALLRPPCVVSFSGGRDSSLVLSAAVRVARREGLALPVPVTNRFAGVAMTDETRWQEQVVADLALDDWQRLEFTDELDAVGPYAQRLLRRHGLLWPFNVHFHMPLLEVARGGSLLTGVGGDEILDITCRGPQRSRPRALALAALQHAPRRARAAVFARRRPIRFGWLRPHAQRMMTRARAAEEAAEPRRPPPARMAYRLDMRYLQVARACLDLCAADVDVALGHPLCAPELWSAIARRTPAGGFATHERALRALFAGYLPDIVAARTGKAMFDDIFWHRHSRAFAQEWDGAGVPHELVDAGALREQWRGESPPILSLTLMQAAWLACSDLPGRSSSAAPKLSA